MKVSIAYVGSEREQEIVNWTIENCKSFITMDTSITFIQYSVNTSWILNFYFSDAADASWFLLRWS